MNSDVFIHYNTPEEYVAAVQRMINARSEWRAHIQQQKASMAL